MSPSSFPRALHALQNEKAGYIPWLTLALTAVITAWLLWALLAQFPDYETAVTLEVRNSQTAVAQFAPAALLRLEAGQTATLRLNDFPATTFGTVPATVTRIDGAVRGGLIQVILRLEPPPDSAIPLQAGLTGTADIEVGQVTPAALLFSVLGQRGDR